MELKEIINNILRGCMSRRRIFNKNKILPDIIYNSELISKFINLLMLNGKKSVAENILYKSLDLIELKCKDNKIKLLELAVNNVKPIVEIKTRRVGGTTYQIPIEVRPIRANTLAIRWIIKSARNRSNRNMILNLTNELFDSINKKGLSIKKRDEVHKIADANKAFAHYRW